MGVMSCSREGCHNILCRWYSYTYGYLCDDCFEELLNKPISIQKFMDNDRSRNDPLEEHRSRVLNEFDRERGDVEEED